MSAVKGDTVYFQYKSICEGELFFDSEYDRDLPYKIRLGYDKMIPEIIEALIGMDEKEVKKITVSPENTYGFYREDMVVTLERSAMHADITPVVGMMLQGLEDNGVKINAYVKAIDGDKITLDCNHRFAGKDIDFEIKLLKIEKE
jgi:peptidylprolyl isomerase